MKRRRTAALLWAVVLAGCEAPPETEPDPPVCSEGTSQAALTAVDRKIVGEAAAYPADFELRGQDEVLAHSQRLRRETAWKIAAKVLADVPLSQSLGSPDLPAAIPTFQTWYDLDDLRRVFHRMYGALPAEDKQARKRFSKTDLDDNFAWNLHSVEELPNWPEERYQEYLAAIDTASDVAGLGGISRVVYSPGAARHLISSYPEILTCHDDGPPPADVRGPVETVDVAREGVAADACERREVGSYAIGDDETLRVVLEDGPDVGGAELVVRAGDVVCRVAAAEPCEIEGPATAVVSVSADDAPIESVVEVTRLSTRPPWSACLDGPFPGDAVVVKADYRRADFEMTVPTYSTSASALAARLAGNVSWEVPDGEADPSPDDIYTLTLPNGSTYRLAGLHIMTKELDHWVWITLFWSESPNEDFGADRPASIESLEGPWRNYKMCVVTAFAEGDAQSNGGFAGDYPSLGAALDAVYSGVDNTSWCSNPYIEEGHGNAKTNCIGCHQHGGTDLRSEDILLFAGFGTSELRNNFPTDYSWAVTSGDHLGQLFADEEAYYLGAR
ncbi:MAG: hypothetical protein HOW73_17595 [Polyangiaceae bacterium]|nr:hypothetical protein [Polyangiaceae bacterium]